MMASHLDPPNQRQLVLGKKNIHCIIVKWQRWKQNEIKEIWTKKAILLDLDMIIVHKVKLHKKNEFI